MFSIVLWFQVAALFNWLSYDTDFDKSHFVSPPDTHKLELPESFCRSFFAEMNWFGSESNLETLLSYMKENCAKTSKWVNFRLDHNRTTIIRMRYSGWNVDLYKPLAGFTWNANRVNEIGTSSDRERILLLGKLAIILSQCHPFSTLPTCPSRLLCKPPGSPIL